MGVVNIVVWFKVMIQFCKVVMWLWLFRVWGYIQCEGDIIYVVVIYFEDWIEWFLDFVFEVLLVFIVYVDEVKCFLFVLLLCYLCNVCVIFNSCDFY